MKITTSLDLTILTSTTLTETITEGVETTDGTKVVTHVTSNGNKDVTKKNQTNQ